MDRVEAGARQLFQAIATATGLSPIFAPGTLRRALEDIGVSTANATPEAYKRALPALEARMRALLPPAEIPIAMARVRAVLSDENWQLADARKNSDPSKT